MNNRLPKPCDCQWNPPEPQEMTMGIEFLNGGSITTKYQLDVFGRWVPVHIKTIDDRDIDLRECN